MPADNAYAPCKECLVIEVRMFRGRPTYCEACRQKRFREGRNLVERRCVSCNRQMFPQQRQLPEFDGFCVPCRFTDKMARGGRVVTRYRRDGSSYGVALLPHEEDGPRDRFNREDVV